MRKPQVYESAWNPHTRRLLAIFVIPVIAVILVFMDVGAGGSGDASPARTAVTASPAPAPLPPPTADAVAARLAMAGRAGYGALLTEAMLVEQETGCTLKLATGSWSDRHTKGRKAIRTLRGRGMDVAIARIRLYDSPDAGLVVGVKC